MKLLIYGILGILLYKMVFRPAQDGYNNDSKPRILKKKKKGHIPKPKDGDYTDYEEID